MCVILKYKAGVLWVDRATINVGLILLLDIVKGSPQITSMEIGHIIEKAMIVHVESSNALMLNFGDGIRGYAPVRRQYTGHSGNGLQ